jgi:UDP-N-acetylmuramoyl-tripeptide--D-alanyl-D-alanine ligase
MLNFFVFILTIIFFIQAGIKILFWLHLWQIKEYRLDRLIVHIKETIQGRELFFGRVTSIRILLILSYFFLIYYNILSIYTLLVLILFLFILLQKKQIVLEKKIKIPEFTTKIIFIAVFTLALTILLYIFAPIDIAFWILIVDLMIPFIIGAQILFFSIPSDISKDITINKAIKKREQLQNLMVIGITGSYGKGSTKEYMYSILSSRFEVAKTRDTFNTPIGIARSILSDVSSKTKIFIVEMGAYKKGEIQYMCNMVRPLIGILTAVNEQHVSLFGSIENTMKAKYELIDSIPNNGISLFNGNNQNALRLYRRTRKKKILYKVTDSQVGADICASEVRVSPTNLKFKIFLRGKDFGLFKTNLIGRHHIENLLPGIWVAEKMGMSAQEIREALLNIFPFNKTMEPYYSNKNTLLVDDTFNANPASVAAALDYLTIFKGKKILVLQPMIELGESAQRYHFEIGKKAAEICDYLFLTNKNFLSSIQKGAGKINSSMQIIVASNNEIASFILDLKDKDGVVFEGKESFGSFSLLEKRKVFDK